MSSSCADLADRVDESADFMVGLLGERGEHLHLKSKELLFLRREVVPNLDVRRRGVSLVSLGTSPMAFCRSSVASRSLSQPLVELALVLLDRLLRTWCGAWVAPVAKYTMNGFSGVIACWNLTQLIA